VNPTDRLEVVIEKGAVGAAWETRAPTPRAEARLPAVRAALERANVSAVVCTLPANVLLLSGYWPVVGTACAVVWRRGPVVLILPPDEQELASVSWADVVRPMTGDIGTEAALSDPLRAVAKQWGGERIAVERGPCFEPASYAATCFYGASLWDIAASAWPMASLVSADPYLAQLRAHCTDADQERIGAACKVAEHALLSAPRMIRPGSREVEVAARVRARLGIAPSIAGGRSDGYVYCMSGTAAARAYRAYARSTSKRIDHGDLVLIHCNAYVDGYWTDVTRTYCIGDPDNRQAAIYSAIFAAREAALAVVRPGAAARDVDRAARAVLDERGFGAAFKHSTGHGVGFSAIDHHARPQIAAASDDVLECGMVFNIEPAIYLEGYGGARHCDVVAVTEVGARVLTPFQSSLAELAVRGA
jgi:Xaa-Pro aminopeptidase